MPIKRTDIDILLQEGEGTMLEFKEGLSTGFAREVVAMANSAGGRILLGVRDDGSVMGVHDTNDLRAKVQDIARNCDPPVKVLVEAVDGILVVTVRESENKPVQCREGFFLREGATTQKLTRDEIREFFQGEGRVRFDTALCTKFQYPDDFNRDKFNTWLRQSGISAVGSTEDILVNIDVAERPVTACCSEMLACSSLRSAWRSSSVTPMSPAFWAGAWTRSTSSTGRTSPMGSCPTSRRASGSSAGTLALPTASRSCAGTRFRSTPWMRCVKPLLTLSCTVTTLKSAPMCS